MAGHPPAKRAADKRSDTEEDELFLSAPKKRARRAGPGRKCVRNRLRQFERNGRVKRQGRKGGPSQGDGEDSGDDKKAEGVLPVDGEDPDDDGKQAEDVPPPEYDKLKPPPPGLDADDVKASVDKKPRSGEDTQIMIEYLQEQNRRLAAENVNLRKEKEEAANPLDRHQSEAHERAAKENAKSVEAKTNKIDVLETRIARYEDRIDFLLAAVSHAEGTIRERRPIYEFQTAEPDSIYLKIARVEADLDAKDYRIRELEFQLGEMTGQATSWMKMVHLKDSVCINLGQRVIRICEVRPDCSFDRALVQNLHEQVADTMKACGTFERQIHRADARITDLEENVRTQDFELRNCERMMEKKHDEVLKLCHEQLNLCEWLCRAAQQASGVEFEDEEDLPLKASVFASPPKQSVRRRKADYWSLGYDLE